MSNDKIYKVTSHHGEGVNYLNDSQMRDLAQEYHQYSDVSYEINFRKESIYEAIQWVSRLNTVEVFEGTAQLATLLKLEAYLYDYPEGFRQEGDKITITIGSAEPFVLGMNADIYAPLEDFVKRAISMEEEECKCRLPEFS